MLPAEPEVNVKDVELVPEPNGAVTLIGPVVAPIGTEVLTSVSEMTLKLAEVPLNLTAVALDKPEPSIVTVVPTAPLDGVKEEMLGGAPGVPTPASAVVRIVPPAFTVRVPLIVPVPRGVNVTLMAQDAPSARFEPQLLVWE